MLLRLLPRVTRRPAVQRRTWEAAVALRAQGGWPLRSAFVTRSWSAVVGRSRVDVAVSVSFFFSVHGRGPATVFTIGLTPHRAAVAEDVDALLLELNVRLGDRYRRDRFGDAALAFVLRDTDRPAAVLAEFENVGRALGDERRGYAPRRLAARTPDARLWEILAALRAGRLWQVSSLELAHAFGDDARTYASATVSVMAQAPNGRAATAAHFFAHAARAPAGWRAYLTRASDALAAFGYGHQGTSANEIALGLLFPTLRKKLVIKQAGILANLVEQAQTLLGEHR